MKIHSNGSHWNGEEPDSVTMLIEVLGREPLDPMFEDYGNFVIESDKVLAPGEVRCWGNFAALSHVFAIDGTRAELSALIAAIHANQSTPAYAAAKVAHDAGQARWVAVCEKNRRERDEERRENLKRQLRELGDA